MRERKLKNGGFVYRGGDRADAVYSVISGFVILRRTAAGGGGREQLIGPGAIFGAAEVLSGSARAAAAQAHGRAVVAVHTPKEIMSALADRPEAADAMVATLLAARRTERFVGKDAIDSIGPNSLHLVPLVQTVIDQLGNSPVMIDEFPFVIGRQSDVTRASKSLPVTLSLVDKPPFQLSRRHISIDRRKGRYIVRDCRSFHGTIVNGAAIGTGTSKFQADLSPGENEIIAGTEQSPFRFSCFVPVSAAD